MLQCTSLKRTSAVNFVFQEKFTDSRTMTKNRKKAKKVSFVSSQQCSEPENHSMSSGPVNDSMNDGESGRFLEEASDMNKNKENMITSSPTKTDELNMKPEPQESNQEELSHLKNNCRALKSNLNTMKKKYEDEKKEKEKLYEENKDLKSKLSSLEKELQAAKMQIQKFKKESARQQNPSKEDEKMEVEAAMDNASEQQEQEASIAFTCVEREDSLVQNNAQGLAKGNDPWDEEDEKQWDKAEVAWPAVTEAGSSSHLSSNNSVPAATGSGTRGPTKGRGNDMGQRRNEWHQRQPPYKNEVQSPQRNEEQQRGPYASPNWRRGRGSGVGNRGDHDQNYRRGMDDRGDHGQNYNRDRYDHRKRAADEPSVVTEITGDLFTAPPDCSLAHCVAEDMRMGSGIAVGFRQKFKRVGELLDQRTRQGNVAVLEDEGRYIYYLVTKRESNGKPTMETLERSLEAMRDHVIQNQVKKIAMPRIGCGLDRLEWHRVKPRIENIFSGKGAQITVYNYNEGHGKHKPKERSKSGSMERNSNSKKSKKGKNKFEKKPEKYNKKGEKKHRN